MQIHKNFFYLFFVFLVIWLLLNASLSWQIVLSGTVVSALLVLAVAGPHYALLGARPLNATVIRAFLLYILVFLKELVKANLDVALIVVNPSLPINPGIVEVKTKLTSPIGRLVLANSITLTPGTLTVETKDDSFFIHWINVSSPDIEAATQKIVGTFEKYLEVIYG